ncbi:heterokaryon incompatibility protein-domain-containing protein [Lasiosphaeria miniovina]|uniref:Heterokaryon incompatibility protein-domain-containing protein n=1 Tax=Lasiosphaeria miniovina TaxID=1954250 RepID=A0AA40A0P3_9PEZI|nr:heterokaryon incompatibility protein-domain-containing protein [Lasiosphaeria miniovina]KAK0707127.1 heterokaryon incompatibility protein-domain-containing protein [Lasiosphaeria miniovina]
MPLPGATGRPKRRPRLAIPSWIRNLKRRSRAQEDDEPAQGSTTASSSGSACSIPIDQDQVLISADGLCSRCNAIDFEAVFAFRGFPRERWWEGFKVCTLEPLFIDADCSLCRLFRAVRYLSSDRISSEPDSSGVEKEKWHLRLLNNRAISGGDGYTHQLPVPVVAVVAEEAEYWSFLGNTHNLRAIHNEGAFFLLQTTPDTVTPQDRPYLAASPFDPASVSYARIRGWLRQCDSKHAGECRRPKSKPKIAVRCIDCISPTHEIVQMDLPRDDYFALSYVWGAPSASTTTTTQGGSAAKGRLQPTGIPAVVTDAMQTVAKLGKRYLWVDKYCIDQDNHDAKLEEIQNMDQIYRGAYATLVAAAGTDASFGLAGVSQPRTRDRATARVHDMTLVAGLPLLRVALEHTTWATRGWTYQEAVLSRRAVVFTPLQAYFVCGATTAAESMASAIESVAAGSRTPHHAQTGPAPLLPASHFSNWYPTDRNPARYTRSANRTLADHIAAYTSRHLTVASDVLHAFRGLLARAPFYSYHGVPVLTTARDIDTGSAAPPDPASPQAFTAGFAMGLAWEPAEHTQASDSTAALTRREGDFPSWSWTGWTGPVEYANAHRGSAGPLPQPSTRHAQVHVEVETASGARVPLWDLRPADGAQPRMLRELSPFIHVRTLIMRVRCNNLLRDHPRMMAGVCTCHPCEKHSYVGDERVIPEARIWGNASFFAGLDEGGGVLRRTWDCVLLLACEKEESDDGESDDGESDGESDDEESDDGESDEENSDDDSDDSDDDDDKTSHDRTSLSTGSGILPYDERLDGEHSDNGASGDGIVSDSKRALINGVISSPILVWTFLIVYWDGEAARRVGTLEVEATEERFYRQTLYELMGEVIETLDFAKISTALQQHQESRVGEIHNLKPDSVRDHLADNLSWVAVRTDGIVIPWENLPKTKVYILKGKAEHYDEVGKLSYYHDYQPLPEVTVGKAAGASRADYGLPAEE